MDELNKFRSLWDNFIAGFKGSLITQSKSQTLTLTTARFALADALLSWKEDITVNGRWLLNLCKAEPKKGQMVKEILTKDVHLEEEKMKAPSPNLKLIVPVGAGIIGYGLSWILRLPAVWTAVSTVAPMAAAYPLTARYLADRKASETEKVIDAYAAQLDKYKLSIESILTAPDYD